MISPIFSFASTFKRETSSSCDISLSSRYILPSLVISMTTFSCCMTSLVTAFGRLTLMPGWNMKLEVKRKNMNKRKKTFIMGVRSNIPSPILMRLLNFICIPSRREQIYKISCAALHIVDERVHLVDEIVVCHISLYSDGKAGERRQERLPYAPRKIAGVDRRHRERLLLNYLKCLYHAAYSAQEPEKRGDVGDRSQYRQMLL